MRQVFVPSRLQATALPLGQHLIELGGQSMGTTWSVRVLAPAGVQADILQRGLELSLARIVRQMSPWERDADTTRYAAAAPGSWVRLPSACWAVLGCAVAVAQASGGAFDPTASPLVRAWGFGPGPRYEQADFAPPDALGLAAASLGWQHLKLDKEAHAVWQPGGIELDFCGVAKGYGVDQLSQYLLECGLPHHLVEVGGELRGSGLKPDGRPWWVELEVPPLAQGLSQSVLALHGLSVATSGDYRRCYEWEGQHQSHTLDPRTRRPVQHGLASVSVLHDSCMWADAWATALMVLGPRDGPEMAASQGLAVRFVWRDEGCWREHYTPTLLAMSAA